MGSHIIVGINLREMVGSEFFVYYFYFLVLMLAIKYLAFRCALNCVV